MFSHSSVHQYRFLGKPYALTRPWVSGVSGPVEIIPAAACSLAATYYASRKNIAVHSPLASPIDLYKMANKSAASIVNTWDPHNILGYSPISPQYKSWLVARVLSGFRVLCILVQTPNARTGTISGDCRPCLDRVGWPGWFNCWLPG